MPRSSGRRPVAAASATTPAGSPWVALALLDDAVARLWRSVRRWWKVLIGRVAPAPTGRVRTYQMSISSPARHGSPGVGCQQHPTKRRPSASCCTQQPRSAPANQRGATRCARTGAGQVFKPGVVEVQLGRGPSGSGAGKLCLDRGHGRLGRCLACVASAGRPRVGVTLRQRMDWARTHHQVGRPAGFRRPWMVYPEPVVSSSVPTASAGSKRAWPRAAPTAGTLTTRSAKQSMANPPNSRYIVHPTVDA